MNFRRSFLCVFIAASQLALADSTNLDTNPAKFPTLPDGFQISLFASEPMVRNPTCIAFDRLGRAFVAQGPQFRSPKENTPGDSIKILIDHDDDGVADETKTFAKGFNSIHGLAWKGRSLYVANSPDFTVVRDTDGDDVADEYIRIYTDLGNIEHSLHGLNWGPDGKLYMSKGNSKGLTQPGRLAPKQFRELWGVESPKNSPDLPTAERFTAANYRKSYHNPADDWGREGGVLRCDPMGENLEIISRGFRNPWDMAMDDGFNFIGTDNDQNEGDKIFMPFYGAHFGWGHTWSYNWTDASHLPTAPHSGPFFHGSGTGVIHYSLNKFPEKYRNVFFINDWGRKCTYVMRNRWDGALLRSVTGDEPLEIFADANNSLYKPTDIEIGPDGALWVLGWGDEYGVKWNGDPKLENQANEGRIFRIWHRDNPPDRRTQWRLAKRSKPINAWTTGELIDDLGHPIAGWRVDAQDELVHRGNKALRAILARLDSNSNRAQETWLVWTLARLLPGNLQIDRELIRLANGRENLNQQIQSLRALAKRWNNAQNKAEITDALKQALGHDNARVRFEAVQAIWQTRSTMLLPEIVKLVASEKDRLTFYSAWGAMRDLLSANELRPMLKDQRAGVRRSALLALLDHQQVTPKEAKMLINDPDAGVATVAALFLSKVEQNMANLLEVTPNGGRFVGTQTITIKANINHTQVRYTLDGSEPNGRSKTYREPFSVSESVRLLAAMFRDGERVGPLVKLNFQKTGLSEITAQVVELEKASTKRTMMLSGSLSEGAKVYIDRRYLFTEIPVSLRGSIYLMTRNDDSGSRGEGLARLSALCLVDVYIAHDKRIGDAVKPKWLERFNKTGRQIITNDTTFDLFHKRFKRGETIVIGGNSTDGTDAGKSNYIVVFDQALTDPQPKPVAADDVLAALGQADPGRGRHIFYSKQGSLCFTCHHIDGDGTNFGPELSGIGARDNAATILQSILEPNARLVEGYRTHIVQTRNGKTYAGMALEESGLTFKLGLATGQSVTLDKKQIVKRESINVSPMPAGYSVMMNAQQLADLVAYLVTCRDSTTPTVNSIENKKEHPDGIRFSEKEGQVEVRISGRLVATYVYDDPVTLRPYFKNVKTLGGTQVTRNNPPLDGIDSDDHASMHPGIWMAFGDISGSDFWRNRARVVHEQFTTKPSGGKTDGRFSVLNRFETNDGELICRQRVTHTIRLAKGAWTLSYDCEFSSDRDFYFGDQEEMGLAVRLATPLIEKNGGQLRNSVGQFSARNTWGQPAIWCDYSGEFSGRWAGITVVSRGNAPRIPWWHNRDYGLMVANQFGRNAMKQGGVSLLSVKAGSTLQLEFTVIIHEHRDVKPSDRPRLLEQLVGEN